MKFEGEHLLPGQLGHFFVILAFVASLVSLVSFFRASRLNDLVQKHSWIRFAKTSFLIQVLSILIVFSIIFFLCFNHYYEYMYAYKHASKELEPRYLLACIWKARKEASCYGPFGTVYLALHSCSVQKNGRHL